MGSDIPKYTRGVLRYIATSLLGVVFPDKCLVCGKFFHSGTHDHKDLEDASGKKTFFIRPSLNEAIQGLMKPYICQRCTAEFIPVQSPICKQCGMVFESNDGEDHACSNCIQSPKPYGMARAAGLYTGACMGLVHGFKYRGKIQLARPLGLLLFYTFLHYWSDRSIDLVVPVPLHRKRLKERGFHQVYLLIYKWPEWLKQANDNGFGMPEITIGRGDLIRIRSTDPQTGLGKQQRIANVSGGFAVRDRCAIEGKTILLVDDVYTTGATVNACTKILLKNGAHRVDVLTLARAI